MATPLPNSRLQVLDAVTADHVIRVIDVNRPDLIHLCIPAQGFNSAPTGELSPVMPTGPAETLNGTGDLGAISLTSYVTKIETTGAATAQLGVPTTTGLQKRIQMTLDTGDCVIAVSGTGVASITLNDVNDQVELIWDGAGWVLLDNNGATVS